MALINEVKSLKNKAIKEGVMNMMAKYYKDSLPKLTSASNSQIQNDGFLLAKHAEAVRGFCKKGYKVSFRNAGSASLKRITEGHPCKGHDVMFKTVKQKKVEIKIGGQKKEAVKWSYNLPSQNPKNISLESIEGLVGYHTIIKDDQDPPDTPVLNGLYKVDGGGKSVPIILDNIDVNNLGSYFTGDYDMHDLIKGNKRVLPDSDLSIINSLNVAMAASNPEREQKLNQFIGRRSKSPYALIRHGAQTSFMSYLLSGKGISELKRQIKEGLAVPPRLPYEKEKIMSIDLDGIVMFDETGEAWTLNTVGSIYQYYKTNDLLDQIPYYFFFKDLKTRAEGTEDEAKLDQYTAYINGILKNYSGVNA